MDSVPPVRDNTFVGETADHRVCCSRGYWCRSKAARLGIDKCSRADHVATNLILPRP